MTDESDLLHGARAIADFLGMTEKQARHKIERRVIPSFKLPGSKIVCARRSTLTAWLARCEADSNPEVIR